MMSAEEWRERVFAAFPRETYRFSVSATVEFWREGDSFRTDYKGCVFIRHPGQAEGAPSPCVGVASLHEMGTPETALASLREQIPLAEAEWTAWEAEHGPAYEPAPDPPETKEMPF